MPAFDPKKHSSADLAELIQQASCELARRLSEPTQIDAPAEELPKIAFTQVPPASERAFVDGISKLANDGQYIDAADRGRIADLAGKYPEWMRRQGIPLTRSTGDWRRLAEKIRAIKRAK